MNSPTGRIQVKAEVEEKEEVEVEQLVKRTGYGFGVTLNAQLVTTITRNGVRAC